MAASSLPPLHAKITANAEGLINELNRADNVTRRKTAAMRKDFDKLRKDLAKPFTMGRIGTSIMQGAGIGSGFHIAQKASELIADHWERAAESAKSIEASTAGQLQSLEAMLRRRRNDVQELAWLEAEQASLQRQADEALAPKFKQNPNALAYGKIEWIQRPMTDAEAEHAADLSKKLQAAADRTDQHLRVVGNAASDRTTKLIDEEGRQIDKSVAAWENGFREKIKGEQRYHDDRRKHNAAASKEELKALEDARNAAAYNAVQDFFAPIDKQSADIQAMQERSKAFEAQMLQMWDNIGDRAAQTMADMVLNGEASFGDLVDVVAKAMLEMALRMAIINPIMNSVFGLTGTGAELTTFGNMAKNADGGNIAGGQLSLVGERGPELFKAPTSGSIIPANKTANILGGGKGDTYYIDATGADAAKIAQLEAALRAVNSTIERRAVAAVGEAASRRRR